MSIVENWAFITLIGCPILVIVTVSFLTGGWATVGYLVAGLLGVLSGGLYAVSAQQRR